MKYIIANWKMNMNSTEVEAWIKKFSVSKKLIDRKIKKKKIEKPVEIIISPSTIHLPLIKEASKKIGIELCTQDLSVFDKGAHTGETGAFQIKEYCKYSLVGHSERAEGIELSILKRDICLKEEIKPIVCFADPGDIFKIQMENIIMAWEDPQNISKDGVYKAEDPSKISAIAKEIRKVIPKETPLLYGGSVNENNIKSISGIDELDGVLVGNASLDSKIFADIIRYYI